MRRHEGAHPCVGALDVCPVVWLGEDDRDAAREEALEAAREIGSELRVPVFLYGELASHRSRRERAFFRSGGLVELRRRLDAGELRPDFGPAELHPSAGATLVTARPPLAAFNVELEGAEIETTREIANLLRESGGGLSGVRAIGIDLDGDAPRCRPTCTIRSRSRSPRWSSGSASWRRRVARGRWSPRSSAWSRRPPWTAGPMTFRSPLRPCEARDRATGPDVGGRAALALRGRRPPPPRARRRPRSPGAPGPCPPAAPSRRGRGASSRRRARAPRRCRAAGGA